MSLERAFRLLSARYGWTVQEISAMTLLQFNAYLACRRPRRPVFDDYEAAREYGRSLLAQQEE